MLLARNPCPKTMSHSRDHSSVLRLVLGRNSRPIGKPCTCAFVIEKLGFKILIWSPRDRNALKPKTPLETTSDYRE
jgi:hypothetical protein